MGALVQYNVILYCVRLTLYEISSIHCHLSLNRFYAVKVTCTNDICQRDSFGVFFLQIATATALLLAACMQKFDNMTQYDMLNILKCQCTYDTFVIPLASNTV